MNTRSRSAPVLLVLVALTAGGGAEAMADQSDSRGKPNVLLIVIDTLRADRLGCYGYSVPTSPTIDKLARQAVVFDESYAYSDGTIYSHLALFSSQHVQRINRTGPEGRMLAEVFSANGYRTYGISANPTLLPSRGFDRGFDYYTRCPVRPGLEKPALSGSNFNLQTETRSAEETTGVVLAQLAQHKAEHSTKPWFMFVNYLDPHDPYPERKPWSDEFRQSAGTINGSLRSAGAASLWDWVGKVLPTLGTEDVRRLGELYDAEIRYTDDQISRVLAFLDDAGWRKNTLVVITSDHGEVLGEHDGMFTHMLACYEAELSVPLVIHAPWFEARSLRTRNVAETIDLAPTLLALCAIDSPPGFVGRALLDRLGRPLSGQRPFTRHYHWAVSIEQRRKLGFPEEGLSNAIVVRINGNKLYLPRGNGSPRLYDVSAYPRRAEILDPRVIQGVLDQIDVPALPDVTDETPLANDPELEKALRSLGYVK